MSNVLLRESHLIMSKCTINRAKGNEKHSNNLQPLIKAIKM
jgi:hypothetical protein